VCHSAALCCVATIFNQQGERAEKKQGGLDTHCAMLAPELDACSGSSSRLHPKLADKQKRADKQIGAEALVQRCTELSAQRKKPIP